MLKDTIMPAKLKNYFANRTDIAFAFLYGSYARGTQLRMNYDYKRIQQTQVNEKVTDLQNGNKLLLP